MSGSVEPSQIGGYKPNPISGEHAVAAVTIQKL
jgi:hypothetical protein